MVGKSYPEMINKLKIGFPVVNIETDFHHPIRYGDIITAKISIAKVGGKSCTWDYQMYNQNEQLLWTSKQVTVCVNMDTLQPMELPDWIRDGLSKHML